jgi:predicted NBD/HSP70 family sugar kinase
MGSQYVVGVDLGGTKTSVALAVDDGTIVDEITVPTDAAGGLAIAPQIQQLVQVLVERVGIDISAVAQTAIGGAGVPISDGGQLAMAPNLGQPAGFNLTDAVSERLGHPVLLENDVNMAALAELVHGHAVGTTVFVFVAIGTGIGMGIAINGDLIRGSHGAAGEIGYLPFGADALDRPNHAIGPLEEVTSGGSIGVSYSNRTGVVTSTPDVFPLARDGDLVARDVLDEEARNIARAIVAVNAILDPELVVLGGAIGMRIELLEPITHWLDRYGAGHINLRQSKLATRSTVVGAVEAAVRALRARVSKGQPV